MLTSKCLRSFIEGVLSSLERGRISQSGRVNRLSPQHVFESSINSIKLINTPAPRNIFLLSYRRKRSTNFLLLFFRVGISRYKEKQMTQCHSTTIRTNSRSLNYFFVSLFCSLYEWEKAPQPLRRKLKTFSATRWWSLECFRLPVALALLRSLIDRQSYFALHTCAIDRLLLWVERKAPTTPLPSSASFAALS